MIGDTGTGMTAKEEEAFYTLVPRNKAQNTTQGTKGSTRVSQEGERAGESVGKGL